MQRKTIRFISDIFSSAVFTLACYILCAPMLPEMTTRISRLLSSTSGYTYASTLAKQSLGSKAEVLRPIPQDNILNIPKIDVDGLILEGQTAATLDKGIWRRPETSTPDKGGNTVFVAHRFLYSSGPNTFYHLPKLIRGDKFTIFWQGKEYVYQVYETKVVGPTASEIEDSTREPIVTLYTCTPLWTAENRFVVRAKLVR